MNEYVKTVEFQPEAPSFDPSTDITGMPRKSNRLNLTIEQAKSWWQGRKDWQRRGVLVAGAVFVAAVIAILWVAVGTSPSAPGKASVTQDFLARYTQEQKLLTDNIERLSGGLIETKNDIKELRGKVEKTTLGLETVKEGQQTDPKYKELQQQNIDRLQKLLSTPLVPLKALSSPEKSDNIS